MDDHRIIRGLIAMVRDLRGELEAAEERTYELESAYGCAMEREAQTQCRVAQVARDSEDARLHQLGLDSDRRAAVHDMERARSYGDSWGVARATRKLREL
jgi:hypothetical protein